MVNTPTNRLGSFITAPQTAGKECYENDKSHSFRPCPGWYKNFFAFYTAVSGKVVPQKRKCVRNNAEKVLSQRGR